MSSSKILKLIKNRKEISTSPGNKIIMNTKKTIPEPQDSVQEVRTNQNVQVQHDEKVVEQTSPPPPTTVPTPSSNVVRNDVVKEQRNPKLPKNDKKTQIGAHLNQKQRNHDYFPATTEAPNHDVSNPQMPLPLESDHDKKPKPGNISVTHPVVTKIPAYPAPDYGPTKNPKNNEMTIKERSNPEKYESGYEKTEFENTRVVNPIMEMLANLKPDYDPIKKAKTDDTTMKEPPKPEENTPIMPKIEPTKENNSSLPSIIPEVKKSEEENSSKTETIANDIHFMSYTPYNHEIPSNTNDHRSSFRSKPKMPICGVNGDIVAYKEIQYPSDSLSAKFGLSRGYNQASSLSGQSSAHGYQTSSYIPQYPYQNAQGYSLPTNIPYSNPEDQKYTEKARKKTNKHRSESEKPSAKNYKDPKPEIKPEKFNWVSYKMFNCSIISRLLFRFLVIIIITSLKFLFK